MIRQLLYQLFSGQCNLKSLQLDISNDFKNGVIHRCFASNSYDSSNSIGYEHRSSCVTLRRLHIRINQAYFFENMIERVTNL